MTYRELLEILTTMDEDRLDDTVTVYEPHDTEFVAVIGAMESSDQNDVLDEGHLFLIMKA